MKRTNSFLEFFGDTTGMKESDNLEDLINQARSKKTDNPQDLLGEQTSLKSTDNPPNPVDDQASSKPTDNFFGLFDDQTNIRNTSDSPDFFDDQTTMKSTGNLFDLFDEPIDLLFNVEEAPKPQENMPSLNPEYWYQDNDINTVLTGYLYANNWLNPQKRFFLQDPTFCLFIDAADNVPYIVAVTPAVDTIGSTPIQYFLDKNHQAGNSLSIILKEICDRYLIVQLEKCQKSKRPAKLRKLFPKENDPETIKAIAAALEECNFNLAQLRKKIAQLDANDMRADVFDEIMPTIITGDYAHARILCPLNLSQRHWVAYEIELTREQSMYDITVTAHDPYGYGEVGKKELSLLQAALTKRIRDFHPGIQPDITITAKSSPFPPRQHPEDKNSCGVIIVADILQRIEGKPLGGDAPYPVGALSLRTAQYQHTVNTINANKEQDITAFKNRVLATPLAVTTITEKATNLSTSKKKRDPKKPLQDNRSSKKSKEDSQAQKNSSAVQTQPQTANQQDLFTNYLLKSLAGNGFTGNIQQGFWTKDNNFIYFVDTDTQQALLSSNMDTQTLFNKVSEIMYKQNPQGASHFKIIFFSNITTPYAKRSEAYSCTILDYQLNATKEKYEPANLILIDPFHYKKYPNKPKLDSAPKFLSSIMQTYLSQVTTLDKIGTRSTKCAFIMALYVSIIYAFKNTLITEISEDFKNKLWTKISWPKLATIIKDCHLLPIKDNHVKGDQISSSQLPSTGIFNKDGESLKRARTEGQSVQNPLAKNI